MRQDGIKTQEVSTQEVIISVGKNTTGVIRRDLGEAMVEALRAMRSKGDNLHHESVFVEALRLAQGGLNKEHYAHTALEVQETQRKMDHIRKRLSDAIVSVLREEGYHHVPNHIPVQLLSGPRGASVNV